MIIVKPNGGLGNRMRVIHSAILLARMHQQKRVTVLWKKDSGLNAGFYELFEEIPSVTIEENIGLMALKFYGFKYFPAVKYVDDKLAAEYQFSIDYWQSVSRNFLINTCMDFLPVKQDGNLYSLFKPVAEINRKVEELKKAFTDFTIGVQIRRTDNRPAIANSPLEGFINAMHKIINEEPRTTFFLCTDDKQCESDLKKIFGHRIMTQESKILNRDSSEGIRSAVIDLYGLGSTKYILGSFQSSFGEVAAFVGNVNFIAMKTINK